MPLALARTIQAGLPAMDFGSMAQVASEVAWEEQIGNSLVVREPVGVVGCITPWNYPLHQICAKVGPALTAGCSVVVKPSEVTPLTSFVLAEIVDSLDLPAGVFNLVTGFGPVVGEAIAAHEDVDMVSFTGSTRAGRRVAEVAADTVKRVALELGGKSANVILDDADLKKAVGYGVANCYLNSGQTCSAHTRMLVPREKLAEAEAVAPGGRREGDAGRSVRRRDAARAARLRGAAGKGSRLHREGPGGGRQARHRRHGAARGAGERLLRPPDGLLRGEAGHDHRPGGDLRTGALDHSLRLGGRGGGDRQLDHLRAGRRCLVGRPGAGEGVREADAHGPGADQRSHVQPIGPVRRLQAVRPRPRIRPVRSRGVPRGQVHPDLTQESWITGRARAQARATAVRRRMPRSPMAVVKLPMWLLTKPNETPVSGSPQPPLPPNP